MLRPPPLEGLPAYRADRREVSTTRATLSLAFLALCAAILSLMMLDGGGVLGIGGGALVALLGLVGCRLGVWLLVRAHHGRIEVVTEGGRLWLPVARPVSRALVLLCILTIALGVTVVVGVAVDGWGSPVLAHRGGRRGYGLVLLLAGSVVAAALCVPVLAGLLRGTRGPRRVGFGPEDVVRERGNRILELRVPWRDVGFMWVTRRPRRTRVSRLSTGLRLSMPGPLADDGPDPEHLDVLNPSHASDARLVALLVLHYRDHPEDRHELGTPAAERRVREGRLAPLPDLPPG